ncbi:FBP domain-containing protein [Planotetraspora sp. A-T 1434]|uniref:FBP domain-containing protein n=1 Tax=Planotetraspora sp. A-T 1434 TaxID=2979219 RepID=UPI0021C004EF|nr:FBP domain-containing protein [Planotetraspora sp. A-T 1434]MCT9934662.1 FBP domain-containing protein [Planotetraspora sp. A-T 1434]
MKALSEQEIRASFVNCSKGEAKRLALPRGLAEQPWDDLDFLGWRDPGAPDRGYLVTDFGGQVVGLALRVAARQRGYLHSGMCSVCLTTHPGSGVSLMTARRAGQAGRDSNSVGVYVCSDLACSLYVRGVKIPDLGWRLEASLTLEEQIDRTRARLSAFLSKVMA